MTHPLDILPSDLSRERLLDAKQTAALYGLSVPHFRRQYRKGAIPKPILIGERKYGWRAGLVLDDIAARKPAAT